LNAIRIIGSPPRGLAGELVEMAGAVEPKWLDRFVCPASPQSDRDGTVSQRRWQSADERDGAS
jgi:hypothetical protein